MKIIKDKISLQELNRMSEKMFGRLVKAVVDIDKEIMVIDAELHADQEELLLKNGSEQKNLWGINLYPNESDEDFIEFDSMINVRPTSNNRSRFVEDDEIRKKIVAIVNERVEK